jgi:hypothetical protein
MMMIGKEAASTSNIPNFAGSTTHKILLVPFFASSYS